MKLALAVLLILLGCLLLSTPCLAGEIEGHVFGDSASMGTPGVYDPGIDLPASEPVLLTQIGIIGGPPGDPALPLNQWFQVPGPDGFYSFVGLPDDGIFQIDLPFVSPIVLFEVNIVETDPMTGMKMPMPVPAPPLGITAMPPSPTEVDIPILGAVAPAFGWASPAPEYVIGGVFVDRNPGGTTGGCGIGGRSGGCTLGNQEFFGTPADGIAVVLQALDAMGNPTGPQYVTLVGSDYTFVPDGDTVPTTQGLDGIFMFLGKALADGESVRVSIDPTQSGLAGLLPVSPTSVVRTLDESQAFSDDKLPAIEFRFQPVFDLGGHLRLVDTQGVTHGMPGVTLTLIDLVTNMVVTTTTTDVNGHYVFPDLFNSVYLVTVENTSSNPTPMGVRQIENLPPADLDFLFDQGTCPDGLAPTLNLPADIVVECTSTSGTQVTWAATATDNVTPAADILISYSPFQPGDVIPGGFHAITVQAADWCGNTATGVFFITVQDTTPPDITCGLIRTVLWPPSLGLLPVGLTASAADACDGVVDVVVTVFSDEADGAAPLAPDALGQTVPDLRLRAERDPTQDGRVYLLRITATDRAGNTAVACKSAIVPLAPVTIYLLRARAQAAAGEAACAAVDPISGVPAGFVPLLTIGTPPIVGQ